MILKFQMPIVPNFVHLEGMEAAIPIECLSKEQLECFFKVWKKALIVNYNKRKKLDKQK